MNTCKIRNCSTCLNNSLNIFPSYKVMQHVLHVLLNLQEILMHKTEAEDYTYRFYIKTTLY